MAGYDYTISDIESGKLNTGRLYSELYGSTLSNNAVDKITTDGDANFSVFFDTALSAEDTTILDAVIQAHKGIPGGIFLEKIFNGQVTGDVWVEIFEDSVPDKRIGALSTGEAVMLMGVASAKSEDDEVAGWSFQASFYRKADGTIELKNETINRYFSDNKKLKIMFEVDNETKEPIVKAHGIESVNANIVLKFEIGRVTI